MPAAPAQICGFPAVPWVRDAESGPPPLGVKKPEAHRVRRPGLFRGKRR